MSRKKFARRVEMEPDVVYYKPVRVPYRMLDEVVIHIDEYEALRLADYEGLYHEDAAARMQVSRATFGRIVSQARAKIANALVNGKAIKLEGGHFILNKEE
ncbi:MAG: DUF134 domain-containing protein [Bacteroidales bacterium]|nr:DUF134 domain-containing protein [Bacteroidales bacterium]